MNGVANQQQLAGNFCSSDRCRADARPMSSCRPNAAMSRWRAEVDLLPKQMGRYKQADVGLVQMTCAGVYSLFALRKLNSVVNLLENQKLMTNMCILKDGGNE